MTRLTACSLSCQISGVIGALILPYIQDRTGLSNKTLLVIIVGLMALLPLYGVAGLFVPPGVCIGLRCSCTSPSCPLLLRPDADPGCADEIWPVAIFLGLLQSPFESFTRTLFSELIPLGMESQFFGLFS